MKRANPCTTCKCRCETQIFLFESAFSLAPHPLALTPGASVSLIRLKPHGVREAQARFAMN